MRFQLCLFVSLVGLASSRTIQNDKIQRTITRISSASSLVLKEFGCELDYEGKDFREKVSDVWREIIREEKSELAALANNTIALGFKVMKEVTAKVVNSYSCVSNSILPSDDKIKVALMKVFSKAGGEKLGYSTQQQAFQMKVTEHLLEEIGCGEAFKPGFGEKLRASLLDATSNALTSFDKNHDLEGLDTQDWALLIKQTFEEEINQAMLDLMDCPPVDKTSEKYKEAVLKAIKQAKQSV